jgi:hypothetical protein
MNEGKSKCHEFFQSTKFSVTFKCVTEYMDKLMEDVGLNKTEISEHAAGHNSSYVNYCK